MHGRLIHMVYSVCRGEVSSNAPPPPPETTTNQYRRPLDNGTTKKSKEGGGVWFIKVGNPWYSSVSCMAYVYFPPLPPQAYSKYNLDSREKVPWGKLEGGRQMRPRSGREVICRIW